MKKRFVLVPWLFTFLLALVHLRYCAHPAFAQSPDVGVLLARVGVNEAGFGDYADHEIIAHISIEQARDRGLMLPVYLFSRYTRALAPASERNGRQYIAGLNRAGDEPPGWDSTIDWSIYRPQWLRILARVDAVLAGRRRVRCGASTWGGPVVDAERIAAKLADGWQVAQCGRTKNIFLARSR